MSTVTSADGTVIDYDRYGDGPAVIFLGGAATYRAIDQATTQTAKHLAAEGFTGVDDDRRGRGRSGDTPPWGLSFTAHLAVLLADGNNEEAMRYNLTSVIGLPAEVVDGMARAPWWAAMVAAAPTLVYDHAATHQINLDPDWRARWAKVTVPTIVCSGDQSCRALADPACWPARVGCSTMLGLCRRRLS
jgi:hypothetical protein